MKEQEKQIEKIKKAREHFKYGISHDIFKEPVTSYAKTAIEGLDYMEDIISQESVVLTREEFEFYEEMRKERIDFIMDNNDLLLQVKELKEELKQARKETAEKLFSEIIDKLVARKATVESFYSISESTGISMAIDEVKKIAKQSGVEIKEL